MTTATTDERWVAYNDVSLWSSPELSVGQEVVRLERGDRVQVLSTNHFGMAEVVTQDSRHGWVRTIELTNYEPNLAPAESQAVVQPVQPEIAAAPVPAYDPTLDFALYSSVNSNSDEGSLEAPEPVEATGGFFHGILDAIGNAFSSIGDAIGDIDFGDFDGGDFGGFD